MAYRLIRTLGKAIGLHFASDSVQEMHGHVEPSVTRMLGCTYAPASVIGNPNLPPLVVREIYNLLRAAKRPDLLARPTVKKGWLLDRDQPLAFDLEWDRMMNVTVVGVAYESGQAYSAFNSAGELEEQIRETINRSPQVFGHNIITADLPTLRFTPEQIRDMAPKLVDTMVAAHLVHPHFASESRDEGGLGFRVCWISKPW